MRFGELSCEEGQWFFTMELVHGTTFVEHVRPPALPSGEADPGLILAGEAAEAGVAAFVTALGQHRHFARETDPPRV